MAAAVVIPTQVVAAMVLLSTVSSGSDVPTGFSGFSTPARTPADSAAALGAQLILILVGPIVTTLVTAASVKAVSDIYVGQPTGVKISLRFALRRLGAVIGLELLSGIGLTVGFIALVIPGIWLYGLWSVAVPVLLIERTGPASALGRSRRLVSGRWWPTAGVLLVATIMVSVISGAFQALLVGVSSLPSQPTVVAAVIVTTASGAISTIIVRPFEACVPESRPPAPRRAAAALPARAPASGAVSAPRFSMGSWSGSSPWCCSSRPRASGTPSVC